MCDWRWVKVEHCQTHPLLTCHFIFSMCTLSKMWGPGVPCSSSVPKHPTDWRLWGVRVSQFAFRGHLCCCFLCLLYNDDTQSVIVSQTWRRELKISFECMVQLFACPFPVSSTEICPTLMHMVALEYVIWVFICLCITLVSLHRWILWLMFYIMRALLMWLQSPWLLAYDHGWP